MVRIYAARVIARVADLETIRNLSAIKRERENVGIPSFPQMGDLTVASFGFSPAPIPASAGLIYYESLMETWFKR